MVSLSVTALLRPFARARKRLAARPANEGLMLGLGAGVGLATGLLAALLIEAIGLVQSLSFGSRPGWATILLVPAVGAFGAGVLLTYAFPESSGSGVIQVMRTIAMRGGRFRARVPAGGIAVTGVALGTGASGGREGPIVLIGGSVGSLLGRLFGVGEDALRTLVAAGAAAGIGASFNAPIGGMLFAIELIVGGFRTRSLQVIVVASVVGSVTARQIIGSEIIYQPATFYALSDPRRVGLAIVLAELGLYALLGLAAAGFGLAFLYGEDFAKRMFARLQLWRPFKLALGGLGVGAIALLIPEVLGTGDKLPPINGLREPIQVMLNSEFGVGLSAAGILLLFAIAKLVATCLSIGSGNAIGTFAPALFVGAALGGAVGHVAESLITVADVPPGAFALVGMAALFAAAARAPLTAILIVFELTNDYQLVLPLMLAAGIATFVADRVEPDSVYTHPLRKQGIVYAEPEDVDIMQMVRVGEIMTSTPDTVQADLEIGALRRRFETTRHHGFPVLEGDRLVGVVTLSDLPSGSRDFPGDLPLTAGDCCTRQPVTVTAGDPVFRALRRMATLNVGRLPVVADDDHGKLVGLVRRTDLVNAYQRAVTRSLGSQQRRESSKLRDLAGARFVEFLVHADAPAAHQCVRDVSWPQRTVLTSIQRGGELIMPSGDTVITPGDEIVALTGVDAAEELRALLTRPNDTEPSA